MAGDLNPPPGAVAPTMKRLSDLDPRRVLNDLPGSVDAVHVISQPGQYVLTRDVQGVGGKHGIFVATSGRVTLNLNGFSLNGVAGSLDGISATSTSDLSVFGFSPQEVAAPAARVANWGGNGLKTTGVASVTIAGVSFENNAVAGVAHIHPVKVIHRDLAARNSGGNGINIIGNSSAGAPVDVSMERCFIDASGGDGLMCDVPDRGMTLDCRDVRITKSGGNGIFMPAKPTPADGTARPASSFSFSDVLCSGNALAGVAVRVPNDSPLCGKTDHLRCISNGGNGLEILPYDESSPHSGQTISITSSEFSSNGGNGLRSNNPLYVGQSTAGQNVLHGIVVEHTDPYTLVLQLDSSNVSRNAGGGVQCARGRYANVDCQITDNGGDGISMGQGCLILTNTSVTRSAGRGIAVGMATITATWSSSRRNGQQGLYMDGGTLVAEGLVCEFNGLSGAEINDASSVTLTNCVFNENGQDGVKVRSGVGPVKWMAPESIASRNANNGFDLDNIQGGSLENCKAVGNGLIGFQIGNAVRSMHISGCSAMDNPGGIVVYGTQNVIIGCTASNGPIGAFAINAGNAAGPVISAADVATSCNPRANVAH
jgi:parallel beta-helix repeat protein